MASPIDIASTMIGKGERPDRAALMDYLQTGGVNLDPATTAWCAAFVNATLAKAGMKGTGSNLARSFMNYGTETKTPARGDIAVFSRGSPDSGLGHVGFFEGFNPDGSIRLLSGNSGDSVAEKSYGADRLLGFRHIDGTGAPVMDASVGTPVAPSGGIEGGTDGGLFAKAWAALPKSPDTKKDRMAGLLADASLPQAMPQFQPLVRRGSEMQAPMIAPQSISPYGGIRSLMRA